MALKDMVVTKKPVIFDGSQDIILTYEKYFNNYTYPKNIVFKFYKYIDLA